MVQIASSFTRCRTSHVRRGALLLLLLLLPLLLLLLALVLVLPPLLLELELELVLLVPTITKTKHDEGIRAYSSNAQRESILQRPSLKVPG